MKKNGKMIFSLQTWGHLQTDLVWSAECGLRTPLPSCTISQLAADIRAYVLRLEKMRSERSQLGNRSSQLLTVVVITEPLATHARTLLLYRTGKADSVTQ